MPREARPRVAAELRGAGAHPAAWRAPGARPAELFDPGYHVELARLADRAGLDLLFLPDSFEPPDERTDVVQGGLDAVAIAARVAPVTSRVGLVPTATTTHTEPFHLSKALATVDFVGAGRAGWEVAVSGTDRAAALFGRKPAAPPEVRWREAADVAEVVVRLWDSWEDDAEIRDVATGRFVDRGKLHYVDFSGEFFSVRGPSITPRPPQGHPPIAVRAADRHSLRVAAARADLVRIAASDVDAAGALADVVRAEVAAAGRNPGEVGVLLDVEVLLAEAGAEQRLAELDAHLPHEPQSARVVGTPRAAADLALRAHESGVDGVTFRPLVLPDGLRAVAEDVLPLLPGEPPGGTLRDRLGLPRARNTFTEGDA